MPLRLGNSGFVNTIKIVEKNLCITSKVVILQLPYKHNSVSFKLLAIKILYFILLSLYRPSVSFYSSLKVFLELVHPAQLEIHKLMRSS